MSERITILSRLKKRYVLIRLIEISLLATCIVLITWSGLKILNVNVAFQLVFTLISLIIVFLVRSYQLNLLTISEKSIARFLNSSYSELQSSVDLILLSEDELPALTQIQRSRSAQNLESIFSQIRFPNHVKFFSCLTILCFGIFVFVQLSEFKLKTSQSVDEIRNGGPTLPIKNLPTDIAKISVSISPPAYTRLVQYLSTDLDLKVPENSTVTWDLEFSKSVSSVSLVTASQDTLKFLTGNDSWRLVRTLDRNGFYQLVWWDHETHTSGYYKIEILKDQPPAIKLSSLNQFTQVAYNSKDPVETNTIITDDYGLTDAYIIATVSKGSGESVKFREEKIRFSSPEEIRGKRVNSNRKLDLKKLGLELGDELYFYIEALDNKTPQANRTRTETYFISIPDTAQDVMVADGGLGVDLMPEYFRSQRQIIIDTEKLIREKKTITKKEFNSKSNELGYDQKVLRLRYGQFLGEEAESGIGPVEHPAEEHAENEKPEDMIKEFGHQHDTENEHNLVEEKDPTKKDVDGGKKEDIMAGFIHQHDTEESATFFFQSLKMKLKAALSQMWDAELYLRLYEPEKSLPYQYTALKLLKEISNDSRIYVHRTGFEPPPIKEEKRLSADLNEIFNANHSYEVEVKKDFPKISAALKLTERLLANGVTALTPLEKNLLSQSGNELAQRALENPALLEGLTALNLLTQDEKVSSITASLKILKKSYWQALPSQPAQSGKQNASLHTLDAQLIRQLELLEP